MTKPFLFLLLLTPSLGLLAQSDTSILPIEVDFLLNYYEQQGVHSAVTGGIGTEALTDQAGKILVVVPLDSTQKLSAQTALNTYTSASTDMIDSYVSSASVQDSRATLQLGYERIQNPQNTWGLAGAMSIESDYISKSLSGFWSWTTPDQNRGLDLAFQAFFDTWIVIFPEELRAPGLASVPTDKRRSVNLSATWSQVLHPRLQASVSIDAVVQQGLLSTPFHRVYFQGEELPKIEKLPPWRFKYPVGVRVNYFASDWLVIRAYYRLYGDSFGLWAHTFQLETPLKFGLSFAALPFFRYHSQSAADYFAGYARQEPGALFYTSDYDLSTFTSQKFGLGLRLSPLYGLARFHVGNKRIAMLRSTSLRYARYLRSDGLHAHIFSLDLSWRL